MKVNINNYTIDRITDDALSDIYNYPELYIVVERYNDDNVFYGLFPYDEAEDIVTDKYSGRDLLIVPKTTKSRWKEKYCVWNI